MNLPTKRRHLAVATLLSVSTMAGCSADGPSDPATSTTQQPSLSFVPEGNPVAPANSGQPGIDDTGNNGTSNLGNNGTGGVDDTGSGGTVEPGELDTGPGAGEMDTGGGETDTDG